MSEISSKHLFFHYDYFKINTKNQIFNLSLSRNRTINKKGYFG